MEDWDPSKVLTEPPEATAKTARLPRLIPAPDKTEEEFRAGQSRVLEMVAANAPLGEILKRLVLLIESQMPHMLCSVLLLSDDGEHVRHGAAPSLPEEYVKAIDGAPIGPKNGSCGTAMYRGEPVIVRDVWIDPLWEDYRGLAHACGLRACWSTPIMSGRGKVLGSFAMYYREPRMPTQAETSLTQVATRIAGIAIEHQLAREILTRTQNELAQAKAASGEHVSSVGRELDQHLEAMVESADEGLELLNEDRPDVVRLRETLNNISRHGHDCLDLIPGIRPTEKK